MSTRRHHSLARANYDGFVRGYIDAALWSSTDGDGASLDEFYSRSDISSSSMKSMKRDCGKFIKENKKDIEAFIAAIHTVGTPTSAEWGSVGHDFWLTRNGHGAGFWDRDAGAIGERLSSSSEKFGSSDLYVGEDGKIYVSPER